MSLQNLLAIGQLNEHVTDARQVARMLDSATRSLADARQTANLKSDPLNRADRREDHHTGTSINGEQAFDTFADVFRHRGKRDSSLKLHPIYGANVKNIRDILHKYSNFTGKTYSCSTLNLEKASKFI